MSIDPDGKRLQIDDLIIIPNNMQNLSQQGNSGSALQNLAKIASRYQGTGTSSDAATAAASPDPTKRPSVDDRQSPSKKLRLDQTKPSSNLTATQLAAQQSLLNSMLFSLPGSNAPAAQATPAAAPNPGKASPKPKPTSSQALQMQLAAYAAMMGLPPMPLSSDTSKMSPEELTMLKMYEQMAAALTATASPTESKNGAAASEKTKPDQKSPPKEAKDRSKVCKPPPETKRPPNLMQTACAFTQTSHIYTNPKAEVSKARESSGGSGGGSAALDLSKHVRQAQTPTKQPQLNLKKESSLLKPGALGVTGQTPVVSSLLANMDFATLSKLDPITAAALQTSLASPYAGVKAEQKSSPFSAESLLSKQSPPPKKVYSPSSSAASTTSTAMTVQAAQMAMALGLGLPSQPTQAAQPPSRSSYSLPEKRPNASNPWHTPVPKSEAKSFQSALLGLPSATSAAGLYSATTTPASPTTPTSSSSLATALASSYPGASSLASNPYLALMGLPGATPSSAKPQQAKQQQPPPPVPPPPASAYGGLMDPATSAYYAALYSQQMYGLSPYATGLPTPPPPARPQAPSGFDPLQASALQAMMAASGARAQSAGSSAVPTGSAAAAAAAAAAASFANPFAAAGLAGLSGFPGMPGFPPGGPRKDP